ncbi:methylated-DNA--[protein]-cysteine S-methyltransferase [Nocardia otitidiscaviarum]|uniref:methylated-DNA--[protein]-cysteine S-methyltransferase n=1 Tax=Nocardia otitidiscaviarum TaxID=1823 RepID=UPI000694E283|nr:methylated-DNA--[protein]-cysteine S-methyltransferase [Nocardia otitidiscaviarum]MBF6482849.1 methylated-DNA--[protein]-cysteine S-methyltransferase [Nocardia otitidiscaviarum]
MTTAHGPRSTTGTDSRTADFATVSTPIGPFTAVVDGDGAVLASGWTDDVEQLRGVIHPALRPDTLRRRDSLGAVTAAVEAYHDGDLLAIDTVRVRQTSGPFLTHAWDILRKIPAGNPVTYTEYATVSGRPAATRAAANACARNAAALFVPCHRIIRTDGTLGGFRWGLDIKRWLLVHESATTN